MLVTSLSKIFLLVSVLTVTSYIKDAAAIKCYQCNSALTPECAQVDALHPKKFEHLYKECEVNEEGLKPFCRKIEFELLGRDKEEHRILRNCGWIPSSRRKPCLEFTTDNHYQLECECHDDGCNGSSRLKTSLFVMLASSVLVFIYILSQ